jgi:uncharacterized protein involved in exopolysaccharide biosynthesis
MEITYSDHNKNRGKDVINTLIAEYNKDVIFYKGMEDTKTLQFVDGRIVKVLSDLNAVETDFQIYKTKNEITLIEQDVTMYAEILKDMQSSIYKTEAESRLIDMLDDYVKDPANKNSVVPSLLTVAEGEKGGAITLYNRAIVERDQLLKNSSETNPTYKMLDNEVNKMREGVLAMIDNSRKNYNRTLSELQTKERDLMSKMRTIPAKEKDYVNYRRNQEILQTLYVMLLQKREETFLSLENTKDRARITETPYTKKKPVGPRKLYAAVGILFLTIVIPIVYLFAKDLLFSIKEEYKRESVNGAGT